MSKITFPLTIRFEMKPPSTLAQIAEALDSPVIFYLVFVLPFLLLAAVFRSNREYTCVFGEEGIKVYYNRIITRKIGRDRILGIEAIAEGGAGVLRIRWMKRMNESFTGLDIPGSSFRALNMPLEDVAAALNDNYRAPV